MRNRGLQASLLSALLLVAGTALHAQAWSGRARLQGQVNDPSGKPVDGAKITLRLKDAGPAPLSTNKQGKWSILGLADGTWRVTIEKEGYVTSEGQVKVSEFQATPPIVISLREAPKQEQQPAAQKGPTKGEIVNGFIDQGNALMTEAANTYDNCVAHPPSGVAAKSVKTTCEKLAAPKYDQARGLYQQAYDQADPKNKPAILGGIARVYAAQGNNAEAITTLKTLLAANPEDQASTKLLVDLLVSAGREEEAKPYMAKLPAGTATVDPNALLNLGIDAYNKKKLDSAMGYFDRVVQDHPDMAEAYYYRGLVYLQQGKIPQSKADFQKLLEIDPKNAHAAEVREYLKSL
jgi:tetratricopeptide (TPR) repeat protein